MYVAVTASTSSNLNNSSHLEMQHIKGSILITGSGNRASLNYDDNALLSALSGLCLTLHC